MDHYLKRCQEEAETETALFSHIYKLVSNAGPGDLEAAKLTYFVMKNYQEANKGGGRTAWESVAFTGPQLLRKIAVESIAEAWKNKTYKALQNDNLAEDTARIWHIALRYARANKEAHLNLLLEYDIPFAELMCSGSRTKESAANWGLHAETVNYTSGEKKEKLKYVTLRKVLQHIKDTIPKAREDAYQQYKEFFVSPSPAAIESHADDAEQRIWDILPTLGRKYSKGINKAIYDIFGPETARKAAIEAIKKQNLQGAQELLQLTAKLEWTKECTAGVWAGVGKLDINNGTTLLGYIPHKAALLYEAVTYRLCKNNTGAFTTQLLTLGIKENLLNVSAANLALNTYPFNTGLYNTLAKYIEKNKGSIDLEWHSHLSVAICTEDKYIKAPNTSKHFNWLKQHIGDQKTTVKIKEFGQLTIREIISSAQNHEVMEKLTKLKELGWSISNKVPAQINGEKYSLPIIAYRVLTCKESDIANALEDVASLIALGANPKADIPDPLKTLPNWKEYESKILSIYKERNTAPEEETNDGHIEVEMELN